MIESRIEIVNNFLFIEKFTLSTKLEAKVFYFHSYAHLSFVLFTFKFDYSIFPCFEFHIAIYQIEKFHELAEHFERDFFAEFAEVILYGDVNNQCIS